MARGFQPGLISANHLVTGAVIYLARDGRWVSTPAEAELIADAAEADEWLARAAADPAIAVGAYLAPAEAGPDGPRVSHFREVFRATGPSAPARRSWGAANA